MTRALVLGGYGLIGAAVMRALNDAGFKVTGAGRNARAAKALGPDFQWHILDLARLSEQGWAAVLQDVDVVVNAAGALQDGARDHLDAIHVQMMDRLCRAAHGRDIRIVQISAAGASPLASTDFMRSKAAGDHILQHSAVDHVILRPSLVIGAAAYGGTALLRAAAALPFVTPSLLPTTTIQTVALSDVAKATLWAAKGEIASGTVADLTEEGTQSFPELITAIRLWMGLPDARLSLPIPNAILSVCAWGADALGRLGWRSPLRSNAISALRDGVTGDPGPWRTAGGFDCATLRQTLRATPATVQDRWFAALYLLFPVMLGVLCLFWLSSGLIGLARFDQATEVLTTRGFRSSLASAFVLLGSLTDIALGALVTIRRFAKSALVGMILLPLGYLGAGTFWTPDLWLDPMGVFVKVIPAMFLALAAMPLVHSR